MRLLETLTFMVFALLPLSAGAQTYECRKAAGKIEIDGRMDEAAWTSASPLSSLKDIRGEGWKEPSKTTVVKLLWDDDYFYVGAWLSEDDIRAFQTERDSVVWKDNDFEVFIDPDGDGRNYFEFEINALGTILDLIMDKGYAVGGNFYSHWNCPGLKTAVYVNGTLNDSGDRDEGWGCEFAIPRAALMWGFTEPDELDSWRVNFSRVEYLNGPSEPEENWVWSPTGVVDIHYPDRWGTVIFKE